MRTRLKGKSYNENLSKKWMKADEDSEKVSNESWKNRPAALM